jgi:hypothetical protein
MESVEVEELAPAVMLAGDKEQVGAGAGPTTWQESCKLEENPLTPVKDNVSVTCSPA